MASNARTVTEVNEVREERLRRRERNRLRRERESNEERCGRFVNLYPRLTALGSKDTNLTVLLPSDNCPSKYFTLALFLVVLMGEIFPTNTPSTLAKLEGMRLEISIMPRGNEKCMCTITISSYYRAVAAIFIALIYSILCWLLRRFFFRYGQGHSRAYLVIRSALLLLLKVHTPITHNDTG